MNYKQIEDTKIQPTKYNTNNSFEEHGRKSEHPQNFENQVPFE